MRTPGSSEAIASFPSPSLFWHLHSQSYPPPFFSYTVQCRYYKSNGSIVNIKCKLIILISFQLDSDTKAVDSCRLLNLKQFLAVYKSIQTQVRERHSCHLRNLFYYNLIGFVPIQKRSDLNPYLGSRLEAITTKSSFINFPLFKSLKVRTVYPLAPKRVR
jgi:hypothetical protein